MNKKNFRKDVIEEIWTRDDSSCQNCGTQYDLEPTPHHNFEKSKLFRACVNRKENGCVICVECHRILHNPSNDEEAMQSKVMDRAFKYRAMRDLEGKINKADEEELNKIFKAKGYKL